MFGTAGQFRAPAEVKLFQPPDEHPAIRLFSSPRGRQRPLPSSHISARRCAERFPEHRDETARALIAEIDGHLLNRCAVGQPLQRERNGAMGHSGPLKRTFPPRPLRQPGRSKRRDEYPEIGGRPRRIEVRVEDCVL